MSMFAGLCIDARMNFETSWGTEQDSGHFILPHREFGLTMKKQTLKPELSVGHVKRAYVMPQKNAVAGRITTMLFRDTAYNLLKWFLTRHGDGDQLWSATVDRKSPIGVRRYTGCLVDKAEIACDFMTGDLKLAMDVKGKLEKTTGIAAFETPSYDDEAPFVARHASATLWGGGATKLEHLTVSFANAVKEGPADGDGNVTWLAATRREIEGKFRIRYDDDTYTDYLTGETTGAVVLTLAHPLGGSNGTVMITLPEAQMTAAEPTTDLDRTVSQEVEFEAEMDDDEDDVTWSIS